MNYYPRHLGDYATGAGHLSMLEHGAYTLLLDRYYSDEAPIAADQVHRITRAKTPEEREAVDTVLGEFFLLQDGAWRHARCDAELARYLDKSTKARASAEARWTKGKHERNSDTGSNADGMRSHSERTAEAMLANNQEPVANGQDPKRNEEAAASLSPGGDPPPCPHSEIIDLYHEILPTNPRIKSWKGEREKHLRARWREDRKRQSLDYWRRFFRHVAASPFLTGRVEGSNGRTFNPGLDWLVKPSNFAKVIEHRYHDQEAA